MKVRLWHSAERGDGLMDGNFVGLVGCYELHPILKRRTHLRMGQFGRQGALVLAVHGGVAALELVGGLPKLGGIATGPTRQVAGECVNEVFAFAFEGSATSDVFRVARCSALASRLHAQVISHGDTLSLCQT